VEKHKWKTFVIEFEFHFVDLQILVMHIYQSGYSPDQICPNLLEMRFEKRIEKEKLVLAGRKTPRENLNEMVLSGEVSSHRLVSLKSEIQLLRLTTARSLNWKR
jgi:hypothetical protein